MCHFRGWGHSVYTDALKLARTAGCKKLGLFHLNQERTDQQMDQMLADCRQIIADGQDPIECFGIGSDWQMTL